MWLSLRLFLALVLLPILICAGFVRPPANMVFRHRIQSTGYVRCELEAPVTKPVLWTIDLGGRSSTVIYSHPIFFGNASQKYSIDAKATESGNFTLTIRQLTREDTGLYTCQLDSAPKGANITVADPPGKPVITPLNTPHVEGPSSSFRCASSGGFPAPTFTWYLGSRQLPTTNGPRNEDGTTSRSVLTTTLNHTDHLANLSCVATNILSSTSSSTALDVQFSPRVSLTPGALIVLKDAPFNLNCDATLNPPETSIRWFRDGSEIVSAANTRRLEVTAGVSSDTSYRCVVENIRGTGEDSSDIMVHYAPILSLDQSTPKVVNESSPLVIQCTVDARPEAAVRWMKGAAVVSNTGELSLPSVRRQDAGKYRCLASNTLTPANGPAETKSAEISVTVSVQYAPQAPVFNLNPSSSSGEYRVSERIELSCSLAGSSVPPAIIKWYRSRQSMPIKTGDSLVLQTPEVIDTDEYWCEAENEVASTPSARTQVSFIDVPKLLVGAESGGAMAAVNLSQGSQDYELQCVYEGFPRPTISWYRDGQLIGAESEEYTLSTEQITDSSIQHPYNRVKSVLRFSGPKRSGVALYDFGKFSCLASNSAGESKNNYEIQVNVVFSPSFDGFGKVGSEIGTDTVIPCLVLSFPAADDVKFYRDSVLLSASDKYELSSIQRNVDGRIYRQRRNLTIRAVEEADYGSYTCEAGNTIDTSETSIALLKPSVPDPPTEVRPSNLSWHSLTLSWEAGFDGGYTQSFEIQTFESDSKLLRTESSTEPQHIVTGLRPRTNYLFKVSGVNRLGRSVVDSEQRIATPKLYIPEAIAVFDKKTMTIKISINSTEYCIKLQGSVEDSSYTDLSECVLSSKAISISDMPYKSYRAVSCVPGRLDVCRESPSTSPQIGDGSPGGDSQTITIAVVVSVFVVLVIIAVAAAIFILRKKRRLQKSSANSSKSGHINPIMTPNGVPGEVHFSTQNGYNIHSDLELDEADGLPYGELNNHREESPISSRPHDNLEYVYASVQKKSSEQNKLNHELAWGDNRQRPNNMNIHDPSSVSDNSGYDDEPPSPYREPNILSFIGDGAMAFQRYPSLSGSGYSTPESKQLKKVVYEVIV